MIRTFALAYTLLGGARVEAQSDSFQDLEEVVLVTGDTDFNTNLTERALTRLGWTRQFTLTYNRVSNESWWINDQVVIYEKAGDCMFSFQGVNDETDVPLMISSFYTPPVDMCRLQVSSGIASKMNLLLAEPMMQPGSPLVAYLNNNSVCSRVASVGHSMGGALATLWATCANQGNNTAIFGARQDYSLVTFGPLAMSTTPAFNGEPGTPFDGTRYCVTNEDGGMSASENFYVDTKAFRLDTLDLISKVAEALNNTDDSNTISDLRNYLMPMSSAEVEAYWESELLPEGWAQQYALGILDFVGQDSEIGNEIGAKLGEFLFSGVLSFGADLVCSLGQQYGFQHALQAHQPILNKLMTDDTSTGGITGGLRPLRASMAPMYPVGDVFQILFQLLTNNFEFVNHDICCYSAIADDECQALYTTPEWRSCKNNLLSFLPQQTITCGDIRASYQDQGCCGNPARSFQPPGEDRRLKSLSGEPKNDDELMKMIHAALNEAKAVGDQQESKLAKQILALSRKYTDQALRATPLTAQTLALTHKYADRALPATFLANQTLASARKYAKKALKPKPLASEALGGRRRQRVRRRYAEKV